MNNNFNVSGKGESCAVLLELEEDDNGSSVPTSFRIEPSRQPQRESLPPAIEKYVSEKYRDAVLPEVKYNCLEKICRLVLAGLLAPYSISRNYLIREGEIGLIWYGDEPQILPAGRHVLFSPTTSFVDIKRLDASYIEHGPIKLIQVNVGSLGYAIDTVSGNPIFLKLGRHVINSPTVKFEKFLDLSVSVHQLADLQLVCIKTGTVGVTFRQGHLQIIQPGLHLIQPPTTFDRVISTQQQIMDLIETTYESSDYVPLKIEADVFYQITDPERVCREIKDVERYIRDTSVATLAAIIRNSTLADIGQSSTPAYRAEKAAQAQRQKDGVPSAEDRNDPPPYSFYSKVHDTFVKELQHHAINNLGINIMNIRISTLKINNRELAENISMQAVRYAQVQSELANVENQRKVQNTRARQEAEQIQIHANAEADKIEKLAEAEAHATIAKANAEKEALILQGQGRAQYARLIAETRLGENLAILQQQANAMQGVEKMIYLPSDYQHMAALWSLGTMNAATGFSGSSSSARSSTQLQQPEIKK